MVDVAQAMLRRTAALRNSSVFAVAMALLATPAVAQEAADGQATPEEIVVTGTRISGFSAPTPVTSLSQVELQAKAIRNLADLLVDVPAFKANQNTGQSSQPVGASNLDLRGLGPNRTLLLVDGRRFAATDPTGGIDINVIPASLISRLEIVTGGASAAYGSDAVSGVVNIFLDNKFEGVKGDAQYSQSTYDDLHSPAASLAAGRGFADGRFHVVAAADYYKNDGQLSQYSRPWARGDYAVLANPAFPGTPGAPRQIISSNSRFSQMTAGGVVARATGLGLAQRLGFPAGTGVQFTPNGTAVPFNYGTNIGTTYMTGGDGDSLAGTANIMPQLERWSGYGRATFDLSDSISLYADALWSRADIFSDGTTATDNGTLTIRRDNAFLPTQIRNALVATNQTSLRLGRIAGEDGAFTADIENEVQRYGFGVDGSIGDKWNWNAFVQLSRNEYYREDGNNRNEARWQLGLDSVINPATGQPICRALLANPNPTDAQDPFRNIRDCVPINPFGAGAVSQAALDYYKGVSTILSKQKQDLYAFQVDGRPFSTWAGEVSVAFGAEYRKESVNAEVDAISAAFDPTAPAGTSGWKTVTQQPLNGSLNVKEAFLEVAAPLLADSALGSFDVNGAVRLTDYSTSGNVTTWKVGANYSPFQDLRLRGTVSRDIRAASLNELFSGRNQFNNTITNPITNVALTTPQFTGGNPNLTPERANTFTIGAVYQPSWLPGLKLAVDYYSIEIKNAIASLTGQQIVDACLKLGQTDLCPQITFNGDVITRVDATLINAAAATTKGIDFEAAYAFPMGSGQITVRALANYVDELTTTINGVTTDFAGQVGTTSAAGPASGIPQWRASLSLGYRDETFAFGTLLRYVDGGTYNATFVEGVDIDDNSVPARAYVDVNASVKILPQVEVYANIDNLLNQEPPLTPNAITAPSYASSVFYDRIGRYYTIGTRFRF